MQRDSDSDGSRLARDNDAASPESLEASINRK